MMNKYRIGFLALALVGISGSLYALPTGTSRPVQKSIMKTAAGCTPATAVIDLDINNVRARVMTGGDMWWDQGTRNAAYEVPKGSRKNSLYAGSCWTAGLQNGSLKVAAQTFRGDGNDYWPGPLNDNNGSYEISAATCNAWDRFWKVDRTLINEFRQLSDFAGSAQDERFRVIYEWPARGNGLGANVGVRLNNNTRKARGADGSILVMDDRDYASFIDLNGDGVYNPESGEYPNMDTPGRGDQMIWWVFNDRGNQKLQTKTESIGLEIQTSAFAFSSKDFLNDATFYNYRVINRAGLTLDSAYMATWTDADLGFAQDDYIGCDTARGLGIMYNADNTDGNGEPTSYGENPPMVGVDFFIGPKRRFKSAVTGNDTFELLKMQAFTYFSNIGAGSPPAEIQDPSNGVEFYFYMTGSRRFGGLFVNDFIGSGQKCDGLGDGGPVRFVFNGEMNGNNQWSECVCKNAPGDRRFIHSAGPFRLEPGDVNNIIIGATWVANAGGCSAGNTFGKIKVADDLIQELFDNNFRTIEGPESPKMTHRELDRKLIFYFQNDPISTNFMEKFGSDDSLKYTVFSRKAKNLGFSDSASKYRFEGYRVFQLRNALITPAQIFNEAGVLDVTAAREVFQCDVKNGVSQIVNYTKNIDIKGCDDCYTPVIKVDGKDSGIVHSFQLTEDAFAEGEDKRLVNYKTYYYIAIAYAYNNFRQFSTSSADSSQDRAYLESGHGPGVSALGATIIAAMPNQANGNMGTDINSDYGTGVVITRLEGQGNGGNDLQMHSVSEEDALLAANNYQSAQPIYQIGKGPVTVKVVDPLKVQPGTWKLYMIPDPAKPLDFAYTDQRGIKGANAKWALVKDGDISQTVYSERNIDQFNEQILSNYGLSLAIRQTNLPGDDIDENFKSGLITSDVTYDNPTQSWLAGVPDAEQTSPLNWIRSGSYTESPANTVCSYDDRRPNADTNQYYENMFTSDPLVAKSWAPYALAAFENRAGCGFGVKYGTSPVLINYIQSVDIVFTSDKSKWSRCVVLETSDDNGSPTLSEGLAPKFSMRRHKSWNLQVDNSGAPIYDDTEEGFSYFPGYAVNQETGERLNVFFGEDSYLKSHNGRDMLWNPSSTIIDQNGLSVFGGRHFVYVSNSRYDGCENIATILKGGGLQVGSKVFDSVMWAGIPVSNQFVPMLPVKDGLIPTTTRLRFRVSRPYNYYLPNTVTPDNAFNVPGYPKYQFTTTDLAPTKLSDANNPYAADKKQLLDLMHVVPNPYYAYNGYERNRLDTRVRIINLPHKATIHIYSMDGSLVRKLTKDDELPYIDWDIRNAKSLPIASGMYLIHVKADGIGEKVIKWFGAMRPVDITNY
ncbi:MAG TPA: T9SS type A sorting domain-containing protein [Flavipsychrobacter sp.]|nr:T9SS type A sorting domain-containing protein [Flavipsychrobacter sp.]